MSDSDRETEELRRKLRSIGRDVYAKKGLAYQHFEINGKTLIEGEHKERCRERIDWIRQLDLPGKTVIDLGCNLGLFAIEAARQQAKLATGIDIQEPVIQAAGYIRDFLKLENCRFQVVDLMQEEARRKVEPVDAVFAFAVYDHLTDRHGQVPPSERENNYLDVTEWLARITKESLIVEFHNRQQKWAGFFEHLLHENGFEITSRTVTQIERPVFFCRRTEQAHDELVVKGETFLKVRSWNKRRRKLYILEKDGKRFFCKRYSTQDIERGCLPEQEYALLTEFADCPEVLQPLCIDDRRIVLPYFEGIPEEVIDEQPFEKAAPSSDALRMKLVSTLARIIAKYLERRDQLFEKFETVIPETYRKEVRTGDRILIDVSPSNILISRQGEIRFVDFEPTKPALTRTVVEYLKRLCVLPGSQPGFLSKLFR